MKTKLEPLLEILQNNLHRNQLPIFLGGEMHLRCEQFVAESAAPLSFQQNSNSSAMLIPTKSLLNQSALQALRY